VGWCGKGGREEVGVVHRFERVAKCAECEAGRKGRHGEGTVDELDVDFPSSAKGCDFGDARVLAVWWEEGLSVDRKGMKVVSVYGD
jgi:hypothetical protein